jgi:hypothetical protein
MFGAWLQRRGYRMLVCTTGSGIMELWRWAMRHWPF